MGTKGIFSPLLSNMVELTIEAERTVPFLESIFEAESMAMSHPVSFFRVARLVSSVRSLPMTTAPTTSEEPVLYITGAMYTALSFTFSSTR